MNRGLRLAVLSFLIASNASAHLVVDMRMVLDAPSFVPVQSTFTVHVIAVDRNNDNAYGIVVTTIVPSSLQIANIFGSDSWRCGQVSGTITCAAEQLGPGPNPVDVTLIGPARPGSFTVSTSVVSLGSYDPTSSNDTASSTIVFYDPSACHADNPLIRAPADGSAQPPVVPLSWTAVPGAAKYSIYTSVEGSTPAPVLTTGQPNALLIAEPGVTEWWVEASFEGCPPVDSAKNHFTANETLQPIVSTFTGDPEIDATRDSDLAHAAFREPFGVAFSPSGDLYVSDAADQVVRIITTQGQVYTIAGSPGVAGSTDGQFPLFHTPLGLTVTPVDGYVYAADSANNEVRILYIGGPYVPAFSAAGSPFASGYADNSGDKALLHTPSGVAATERGTIYVADTDNHVIRTMTPLPTLVGVFNVSTLAGVGGAAGSADGDAPAAHFRAPMGVAVDAAGVVYVADSGNDTIRRIANGVVSTLAGEAGVSGANDGRGGAAHFNDPIAIAVDARGNLYVSDRGNHAIRRIAPSGLVTTVGGPAEFRSPAGVAFDTTGVLYVADPADHVIKRVEPPALPEARRRSAVH